MTLGLIFGAMAVVATISLPRRRESDDEANQQDYDDVSDANPSRCEEHIGAEMMFVNRRIEEEVGVAI